LLRKLDLPIYRTNDIGKKRQPVSRKEKSSAIREDPASPMYTTIVKKRIKFSHS
jgi:hypothetical protein